MVAAGCSHPLAMVAAGCSHPTAMVAAGCSHRWTAWVRGSTIRMAMTQRKGRARRTWVAALLVSASASAASPATLEPALSARLRRIETAFRSGDAASLRPAFTANTKVRVDLKDVMEGPGSYGPSQLEVIFGRIF